MIRELYAIEAGMDPPWHEDPADRFGKAVPSMAEVFGDDEDRVSSECDLGHCERCREGDACAHGCHRKTAQKPPSKPDLSSLPWKRRPQ